MPKHGGGSRRQARTVVKEAHEEWLDALNDKASTGGTCCFSALDDCNALLARLKNQATTLA